MLPIATNLRVSKNPWATYTLAAGNAVIHFLLTWNTDFKQSVAAAQALGFTPSNVKNLNPRALPTLFTSVFLHADLTHLIANMLFLLVFGRKVETQLEATNYLVFYLATGVTAGMTHALIDPDFSIPLIGASGAISGVLGAFLIYNPKARITIIPHPIMIFFFWRLTMRLPVWIFLPVWFFIQISMATNPRASNVAFWAHAGGFLMGGLMAIAVYKCISKQNTRSQTPTGGICVQ